MIQYIYFVKCPNCEDEPFDFFNDAKEFACGCLSQKPIITQVEVNRNDFGECTDHCDLGTVWSWEDMMSDADKEHSDKPSLLTKDFLNTVETDIDPEFDALDNSVELEDDDFRAINDEELSESFEDDLKSLDNGDRVVVLDNGGRRLLIDNGGIDFRTEAEWNEFKQLCDEIGLKTTDDVKYFINSLDVKDGDFRRAIKEYRAELGDDFKITNESRKPIPEGMTIEQLVEEMEENEDMVECTWCNDLFPKDQCRYEVDLGYLCSRCEAAIKSRGETLTFRENDYFLDEDFDEPVSDDAEVEESIFDEAESIEDVVDLLVKDEEEAITAYEEAADKIEELSSEEPAEEAEEVLDHIKEEEVEHIEELTDLVGTEEEPLTEALMVDCPECGAKKSFDKESGVCNNCGFIL